MFRLISRGSLLSSLEHVKKTSLYNTFQIFNHHGNGLRCYHSAPDMINEDPQKPQPALFPSQVVGSMPRSKFVQNLILERGNHTVCSPKGVLLDKSLQSSVSYAVAIQEQAGIDIVSDGEIRRKSYIGVIAELTNGFKQEFYQGNHRTIVENVLSPKTPGFIMDEMTQLKKLTNKQCRIALPSPALLGERMYDETLSKNAYPTREAFVESTLPFLRKELELLKAAGCSYVQIDDPHLCLFVDEQIRQEYGDKCEHAAAFAVDMTNELVKDLSDDYFRISLHLCRRAGGRARGDVDHVGEYRTILHHLNRLNVDELVMEFSSPAAGKDMAILRDLKPDFLIGFGCVDVTPNVIDSVEVIESRVEKALEYITPERLSLNPDCGFAPGNTAKVDMDEVAIKLQNLAQASQNLRAKYSTNNHIMAVPNRKKTRIYLDGIFDMFHIGHLRALERAKSYFGDVTDIELIAGVVGDDIAEPYKRRPLISESDRAEIVLGLQCVDEIIVPAPLIMTKEYVKEHRIDKVVHGFANEADKNNFFKRAAVVIEMGIFEEIPYTPHVSTSSIIKQINNTK